MQCTCKTCSKAFKKKLTLKQRTDKFQPKFCSKDCALAYSISSQRKVAKRVNNRIPKSSKEEKVFGDMLRSFFPKLESQWKINGYEHHYDFYSPELNLIIEYNGEYWHNKPKNRIKDRKHLNEATKNKIYLSVITDNEWKIFMSSGMPSKQKLIKLLEHSIKNKK